MSGIAECFVKGAPEGITAAASSSGVIFNMCGPSNDKERSEPLELSSIPRCNLQWSKDKSVWDGNPVFCKPGYRTPHSNTTHNNMLKH